MTTTFNFIGPPFSSEEERARFNEEMRKLQLQSSSDIPTDSPPSQTPWAVINTCRGSRLECIRCGDHYALAYPVPMSVAIAAFATFAADHAKCEAHPEGDVCLHCSGRGHDTETCPGIAYATPEAWWNGTDTGISSKTIWAVMMNRRSLFDPHHLPGVPGDSLDFGRCYRLLNLFPQWRGRMGAMSDVPGWEIMATKWSDLESAYEAAGARGWVPDLNRMLDEIRRQGV